MTRNASTEKENQFFAESSEFSFIPPESEVRDRGHIVSLLQ